MRRRVMTGPKSLDVLYTYTYNGKVIIYHFTQKNEK